MANENFQTVVNGAAVYSIKFPKGPVLPLGISITEQGTLIRMQVDYNGISSDVAGTRPAAKQMTGLGAIINSRLAYVNKETLATLFKFYGTTAGTLGAYGVPMDVAGLSFELGITGPLDQPWHFYGVTVNPEQFNAGTIYTTQSVTFIADPPVGNLTSAVGVKLYDRTVLS